MIITTLILQIAVQIPLTDSNKKKIPRNADYWYVFTPFDMWLVLFADLLC